MKKPVFALFGAAFALATGSANACTSLQDAMTEFEGVKNAYVAKAPTMKPEMFQIWAKHIQAFGDAMGKQDFAGACATLALASDELGLGTGGNGGSTTAATPPPPPTNTDTNAGTPPPPPTNDGGSVAAGALDGTWKECPRGRCRD